MATYPSSRVSARFDRYRVNLSSAELLRAGSRVPIQDQPFQVLRLLLEAEGRVVTREQLRSALWPQNTFVDFEHGVNTAVKKLRQALEDSAENPRFVETLPKIGYRFLLPVEWVGDAHLEIARPRVQPISVGQPRPVPAPIASKPWRTLGAALALILLGALVATGLLHRKWLDRAVPARGSSIGLSQRRLTANPDDTPLTSGVISPDGKYLAYTDPSGFYLRQIDGGETHRVPLSKGFDPLPESWFPDAAHLVVTWFGDQSLPPQAGIPRAGPPSLWRISVMGGVPRKLADEGSSARVSPDGSKIAYLAGIWESEQIWLVDADGNNPKKIKDGGQDSFGAVAWSPDSQRFAYVRSANPPRPKDPPKQIEVYELNSGRTESILADPQLGDEIAWTHSGRLIYSLSEAEPNHDDGNLWSIRINAASGKTSGEPARLTNDRGAASRISVTEDDHRLALLRRSFQGDIYLTATEPQGKRLGNPRRFTLDERLDWPTAWTRDNQAVIFLSLRDGPVHIFRQSVAETQPELLVGGDDLASTAPRLTADGNDVLYATITQPDNPTANLRLMRVPAYGGPSQLILEAPGIGNYAVCASALHALSLRADGSAFRLLQAFCV